MEAIYILFASILMPNLLIAKFSYTFQKIQENINQVWCSQRYRAIKDYYGRPPLPPPLNVVFYLFCGVVWVTRCFRCQNNEESDNPYRAYKLKCLNLLSIELNPLPNMCAMK
ncbi:hypothetical protein NP493_109g04031 [Ridgeia piscesae]|uniref:Uncharacterized protein n=1 Tax=Ridgeia piscesae TaxID=27915 RepID=A0AAD9P751_RIDPI|nr:hypothetical protein NP493_109g04031 [Ridgeia piscesae]